jgi:hypothetical protein
MGALRAVADGLASNIFTWDLERPPQFGDILYANGHTVTLDVDIECDAMTNKASAPDSAVAGGIFYVANAPRMITANNGGLKANGRLLQIWAVGDTTINANIDGAASDEAIFVNNATTNVVINGDINPDLTAVAKAIQATNIGSLSITGTVYGSSTTANIQLVYVQACVNMFSVQGNVFAKKAGAAVYLASGVTNAQVVGEIRGGDEAGAYGVRQTGGYLTVMGSTQGGTVDNADGVRVTEDGAVLAFIAKGSDEAGVKFAHGISSTQEAGHVFVISYVFGAFGVLPISGVVQFFTMDSENSPEVYAINQSDEQIGFTLAGGGVIPDPSDVRDGIEVGASNGTLVVPSAADVREGINFDNEAVGTLVVEGGGAGITTDDWDLYFSLFPRAIGGAAPEPTGTGVPITLPMLTAYYAQFPCSNPEPMSSFAE